MADGACKIFCLCLFFCAFIVKNAHNRVVMEQESVCEEFTGTWSFRPDENANVSAYFYVKYSTDDYVIFEGTEIPDNLPFQNNPVPSGSRHLQAVSVTKGSLFEAVLTAKKIRSESGETCKIFFTNGSILTKEKTIKHVHLIYMNHLDVGFNTNQFYPGTHRWMPGFINNVLNWYFQVYFPRVVRLGNELRDIKAEETFIYTTHPWLVNLYLDCPNLKLKDIQLECPTEEQLIAFRRAVFMGDFSWHAGPLNQEPEASNPELFAYSLTLSQKLDKYFGIKRTARTLSQRDVPGMTQAAIPYLVKNGIVAASFGVNGLSATPDVPSPNVWQFGNYSIITYWHKGGYPRHPGPSPQNPGGLGREHCQMVAGSDHALCFAFRSDNLGPPENVMEIKNYYKILRFEFPTAEIKASTFESFTQLLLPLRDKLPVFNKEIGDTWIQGAASDPLKMSHYRTINRMRSQCIQNGECDLSDKRVDDMSRYLVKLPEHTYGVSQQYLDQVHWTNDDFLPRQYTDSALRNDSMTWLSHRAFNDLAVAALKDHPLAPKIRQELEKLKPYLPNLTGHTLHNHDEEITCPNGMVLKIGPTGALTKLFYKGQDWADTENQLAQIMYHTYNQTDFHRFYDLYHYYGEVGIYKPNMDYAKPDSRFWPVEAHGIYVNMTDDPCSNGIFVRVIHTDMETWFRYGAPVSYFLKYTVKGSSIDIDYQFFNKPTTRLPESLFLSFRPKPVKGHQWYLHKLGYLIDPNNVVLNGSQYVHGVDEGVAFWDEQYGGFVVESPDVGTVCVENKDRDPSPFPTPLDPLKTPATGMAFNLYNNIWEVNFIYWYPYQPQDKHYKARFKIRFT